MTKAERNAKTFRIEAIGHDDISADDLRSEYEGIGETAQAYLIIISGSAEAAIAVYSPLDGRIGIGHGAPADWGDCNEDIESAIGDWLNDEDAWLARA